MGHSPHPKQQQFLLHADTQEVFFGGAGGGGKSQAIWYAALQYAEVPNYSALILRRTYQDLSLPQSLMNRSQEYLANTGAKWKETDKRWTFPSGASVTFGYLETEKDKYRYASAEFQFIAFDELTHFSDTQYRFLFTRLRRRRGVDVPLRMRSASNPGSTGHAWVKARFVDPRTRDPKAVFIPAKMTDNPSLDQEEYRRSLANADPVTRRQIEEGDWDAVAGGRFKREQLRRWVRGGQFIDLDGYAFDPDTRARWVTVDPAASSKQSADYTVVSVWTSTERGDLVWLDCHRERLEIPDQPPAVRRMWERHRPVAIGIECVANQLALFQACQRLGLPVEPVSPAGRDKLSRATPAMNLAANGRLWLPGPRQVPGFPVDDVEAELLAFTGTDEDANDDAVDTCTYAAQMLPRFCGPGGGPGIVPVEPRADVKSLPWAAQRNVFGVGVGPGAGMGGVGR